MGDILKNLFTENILTLLPTMLMLGFIILLFRIFQDKIVSYGSYIYSLITKKSDHYLTDDILGVINSVNIDLNELRVNMKAMRAWVYHFHNGQVFLPSYPSWKMSNTYISVDRGISNNRKDFQNIEISLCWDDFVKGLWSKKGDVLGQGNYLLTNNKICTETSCTDPRKILLIKVGELSYGSGLRSILEDNGVYCMIMSPLLDLKRNSIIGFVGVSYGSEYEYNKAIEDNSISPCKLCSFASQITSYFSMIGSSDEKFIKASKTFAEKTE